MTMVHAARGAVMLAKLVALVLSDLEETGNHDRPHVWDNEHLTPYSRSQAVGG